MATNVTESAMYPTSLRGATFTEDTAAVRSATLSSRAIGVLNWKGQIGSIGTGIMIGPEGINTKGTDRSELMVAATVTARELAVPAKFDILSVKAPNVTLGEGQIRRFRIIA